MNGFRVPTGFEDFVRDSDSLLRTFYGTDDGASDGGEDDEEAVTVKCYLDDDWGARSDREVHALLEAMNERLRTLSSTYIWFVEPLQLSYAGRVGTTSSSSSGAGVPSFCSTLRIGDSVEDEWFVVHLALQLSTVFPASFRVTDNDGEFLLIEAADDLPDWAGE